MASYNPRVLFVYFFAVVFIPMFCQNPIIISLSLLGGVVSCVFSRSLRGIRPHLYFALLFTVSAIINPLFYHNGVTVLFFINNNPITLEALFYGLTASGMIVAVIYWFRLFTFYFTGDKLLYLLGFVSPKISLVISMAIRFVPLFVNQAKKINNSQKALGLYKEDNAVDTVRGKVRIFSALTSWGLENGIITADSMASRGYGITKRSFYSRYVLDKRDFFLLVLSVLLFGFTLSAVLAGALDFNFYPEILPPKTIPLSAAAYLSYFLLVALPVLFEAGERIKWKYLVSKI
jgi:energy-coupling factor transport system permease protein